MSEAIGYTRISEKDQSNNSLDNQHVGITDYCRNNNLTLHKIFTDNGKSAFTFDRPEWLKLETYIKANKKIKYLIVYHIDRFSRATLMDALVKLNEIEVKLKVKVLTVTDRIDQSSNDLSVQMMRTINLLFSNNERNRIQDRVKDGVYRSNASGRFCNYAPYGYKNSRDANDKPLIVIDEQEAVIVKKMFQLYKKGLNVEAIRAEVKKDGFRLNGNSCVQHILSNPIYAGVIKLPAYKGNSAREVNAIHKPIISKVDFYSIQPSLHGKTITVQPREDVWLRGTLLCHCGRKMTAGNCRSRNGNYYWYYKCPVHKKDLSAVKLHKQFSEILDILSFDTKSIEFYRANLLKIINGYQNKKGGNIMRAKLALQKIQKQLLDIQKKYLLDPEFDVNVYKQTMAELRADEARILDDLSNSKTETETMVDMLNDLLPKLARLSDIFFTWPLYRQQLFVGVVFSNNLTYFEGVYRTAFLHPMFADKALILNEKGLLKIEQPVSDFDEIRSCTRERN